MKHSFGKWLVFLSAILLSICVAFSAMAQDNARPRLGLSVSPLQASPLLLQHLRLSEGEGLMVSNVAVGGELEAAGLSQGDIVLAIDGHALSRPSDLTNYVANLPQNAQVTLDVIQKGEHRQIYLKLDNLPDEIVWKYMQPVASPRRKMLSAAPSPMQPRVQAPGQLPQSGSGGIAQQMTFSSIISTDEGMKRSTVRITGASDDPGSEIEVTIDSDTYKTTIGELDKLPEDAKKAADAALAQSQNFSFSFGGNGFGGSFGFGGSDLFQEMMMRHQEQMRMMDELFEQQFGPAMPQVQQPQQAPVRPKAPVLQPVPEDTPKPLVPEKNDIRS